MEDFEIMHFFLASALSILAYFMLSAAGEGGIRSAEITMSNASDYQVFEIDYGRLRVCGELLISVNRSWKVEVAQGERPVAAFKTPAPIEILEAGDDSVAIAAAVGPNDAYWFGFESKGDRPFALVIRQHGINLVAGTDEEGGSTLATDPPNFLLVPDQPWFDAVLRSDGNFTQLIPTGGEASDRIDIEVYRLAPDALAAIDLDAPEPHYGPGDGDGAIAAQDHPFKSREQVGELPKEPCAKVSIAIMFPDRFQEATGAKIDSAMFEDGEAEPPAPFNPFGGD